MEAEEPRLIMLGVGDFSLIIVKPKMKGAAYVTWTFTDRDGKRGYDVGSYHSTEERAKLNYISRVTNYIETYKVTEKPVPTAAAEVETEQNYNMVDGIHNNQDFPQPDLTDGQTDAEIRELAPEMLPDEDAADNRRIPVEIMSEDQPMVTVTFSEDEQLRGIVKLPLYLANTLFFEADERQRAKYFTALHTTAPIEHFLKTDFRIDFIMNGEPTAIQEVMTSESETKHSPNKY